MKRLLFLSFLLPIISYAQETGIQWNTGLSWDQIKQKSKQENKYIFVDAYATWCVPCKKMDKDVYTNDSVADLLNESFINIKIQCDRTDKDSEEIKKRYSDVDLINTKYGIPAYPSFLFFNPDGKLVYKGTGYQDVTGFIKMVADAQSPVRLELLTALDDYKTGKKDYKRLPELARLAKDLLNDQKFSKAIIKDYLENYLQTLNSDLLLTPENMKVVIENKDLLNSKQNLFWLIYENPLKCDTVANYRGISEKILKYVINKEEVINVLWKGQEPRSKYPNWNNIKNSITRKYGPKYSDDLISKAKLSFYSKTKNWREYVQQIEVAIKTNPPAEKGTDFRDAVGGAFEDVWALNAIAWQMFLECNDKTALKKAQKWSHLTNYLTKDYHQYYDTEANLLYKLAKLNKVEDFGLAIKLEEKALLLAKGQEVFEKNYSSIIEKMKGGIPTWPVK